MYFLLKNGDFPASYVSLPEGKSHFKIPLVNGNRDFEPRLCNWLAFRLHLNGGGRRNSWMELMELMGPLATNHLRTCAKKRI